MIRASRAASFSLVILLPLLGVQGVAQQVTGQDLDKIFERADKLLDEAKVAYEEARSKNAIEAFVEAGFKLEEARIKYLVLQEVGTSEKQKVAADRLRAINQLSKLIHDGKVAISGGSAESGVPKPVEPSPAPAPKDPSPNPAAAPAKAPVDVTKRTAVPDPAKQKEAEKQVKDLFKDQYAKKAPADRKALARAILDQAAKSQDDLVALWALTREAQDVAVQGCDVKAAIEAIEIAARFFDVDALVMKNAALMNSAKTAKAPEEFWAIAEALLRLVDELVRADQFDAADKAAASAAQHARKSNDALLIAQATARAKEVAEAKTLFQSMKSVLETLAKTPDDPISNLEIGKFMCFVKGSWDLGLRFMAKGSDAGLKGLAEKELAFPLQSADRAVLADGWYDLGEKEKSPLRKSQLFSHAKVVYESALADAPALVRARIEKRLDALKAGALSPSTPSGRTVDLLKLIDVTRDKVQGDWTITSDSLVSPVIRFACIEIPFAPPEEYDIKVVLLRRAGTDTFSMGLAAGERQFQVLVDGYGGETIGIEQIDGKHANVNESMRKMKIFEAEKEKSLLYSVRKDRVSLAVDGKNVWEWKANFTRVSPHSNFVIPDKNALSFGSFQSSFLIRQAVLVPVTGQGKRLR